MFGWGLPDSLLRGCISSSFPAAKLRCNSRPSFPASTMLPSPERTVLYRRMNRMVVDDCVAITGLSRTRIYLWHKNVITVPDRDIVGGFFLKYVDVEPVALNGD